jgi:hypothetical protein
MKKQLVAKWSCLDAFKARRMLMAVLLLCRRSYKELLDGSSWHLLAQLPGLSSNVAGSHVGKAYRMSS